MQGSTDSYVIFLICRVPSLPIYSFALRCKLCQSQPIYELSPYREKRGDVLVAFKKRRFHRDVYSARAKIFRPVRLEKLHSHGFLTHAEDAKSTEARRFARACRRNAECTHPDGTYKRQRRMLCVLCALCVRQYHFRERKIQSYRSNFFTRDDSREILS